MRSVVLVVALCLLGSTVGQVCGQPNYTVVEIPAGGTVTLSGTFSYANGAEFPLTCGYYIRTAQWEPFAQIVATITSVTFAPTVAANGWSATLRRINEGTNPPVLGLTQLVFAASGGDVSRIPLASGANQADFISDGARNMTDPLLQAARKEMQLTVSFNTGGADRFSQLPLETFSFTIKFTVSRDQCASEPNWFLPRTLSASPDFSNLNHVCQNFNNKSCCNPASAVPAASEDHRTRDVNPVTFEEVGGITPMYSGGNINMPTATYYDHFWAANDTECYHYYQVTACGARCSPNAISKGFISTNWDPALLMTDGMGATTGRRTFRICPNFCNRVWASCKKERMITENGGYSRGTPLSALYVDATSFCLDFFRYTYPPAVTASTQTVGNSKRVAISAPGSVSLTAGFENMFLEVATDDKCFDPAIENGVAGLAVSSLVFLLCLLLSF